MSTQLFRADNRVDNLLNMLSTIQSNVRNTIIIVTCRLENQEQVRSFFGQLFLELEIIQLPNFNVDIQDPQTAEIIHRFQLQGSIQIENWDGTLGSLVLGLDKKNNQYFGIKDSPAGTVLHAMKLLWLAGTISYTEQRVRSVCALVFDEGMLLESTKAWWDAINQLIGLQFITVEESSVHENSSLVIRKDTYFDKVITEYPQQRSRLAQDFAILYSILTQSEDIEALSHLVSALIDQEWYEKALKVCDTILSLNLEGAYGWSMKTATWNHQAAIWLYQGADLAEQGRDDELAKLFQERVAQCEHALVTDPHNGIIWCTKKH